MSPIDRHRLVFDVVDGRCTLHAHGSTNSCGSGHGNSLGVGHVNSWVHANSRGASAHGNSHVGRGRGVPGETKTSSTSTLSGVWRHVVGSLHDEAWVGRVQSSSLRISQDRCARQVPELVRTLCCSWTRLLACPLWALMVHTVRCGGHARLRHRQLHVHSWFCCTDAICAMFPSIVADHVCRHHGRYGRGRARRLFGSGITIAGILLFTMLSRCVLFVCRQARGASTGAALRRGYCHFDRCRFPDSVNCLEVQQFAVALRRSSASLSFRSG